MSKRCELQKEYYQAKGNYKGNGKYSDEYVSWLEEQILTLRIHGVSGSAGSLKTPQNYSEGSGCREIYEAKEFEEAVEPLMKWMSENQHPHTTVIVTGTRAELVEGLQCHLTDEFIVD